MKPSVRIVADSISPDGVRLTTFEVVMHRFVLAEFNTHRVFSRNSASSRAIPVSKQIERIREHLAYPLSWPSEKTGMQGGEPLGPDATAVARAVWREASEDAIASVSHLRHLGEGEEFETLHKSVVNRLLEPFMWHTVIVTATSWENFFAQRCSPMAQPEIRVVAEQMEALYREHKPVPQPEGFWHVPYIDPEEDAEGLRPYVDPDKPQQATEVMCKVSAARCARVSYLTHDGTRSIEADLDLYDTLTDRQKDAAHANDPIHWSPLEHVATPWGWNRQEGCIHFGQDPDADHDTFTCISLDHLPRVGNLLGWRSLRTTVEAERGAVTYR